MTKQIHAGIAVGQVSEGYKLEHGYVIPKEWKVVHFDECFHRLTQKNTENNQNVLTISAQQGLISQLDYYNTLYASEDKTGYFLIQKGDFAYNKSYSADYAYGAIKQLKKYDKGIVSPLYICFAANEGTNTDFYRQYFEAGMFNREIYKVAQEGARNHGLLNVSTPEFFSAALVFPPVEEQKKIAEILEQCDKIISLKQERMEEEKQKKKGLLKQLLHSPESKNWKRYHLSDTGTIITGATPASGEKEFYDGGKIPWITPTDIGGKYIADSERKLTEKGFQVARKIPANSLLVTCIASIGKNAILTTEGSCNQQINAVVLHNQFLVEFMYYLMEDNLRYFQKIAGMTATPIVNAKAFGKMKFSIPDIDTQKKIANILSKQDKLMENIAIELEWWKQKKKALMQLLLTGIVRVKP